MKFIKTTEVAKMIRKSLKEAFPGQKFSVRSDGSSIQVGWTDGPSLSNVKPILSVFEGSSFDGMIDMKKSNKVLLDGEMVNFMPDFIFAERENSEEAKAEAESETGFSLGLGSSYDEYRQVVKYMNERDYYGEPKHSETAARVTNYGADFSDQYPG